MPANSSGVIRVVVVDEVRLMGNVTASVLKNEADVSVLGCATAFDEALSLAAHGDIVLLSSTLPNDDALRLTSGLIKTYPAVKVIVTGLSDSEAAILQYIEAGVSGYVLRDESVERMLATIRAVHAGEAVISPSVSAALMARLAEPAALAKSAGCNSAGAPSDALAD